MTDRELERAAIEAFRALMARVKFGDNWPIEGDFACARHSSAICLADGTSLQPVMLRLKLLRLRTSKSTGFESLAYTRVGIELYKKLLSI